MAGERTVTEYAVRGSDGMLWQVIDPADFARRQCEAEAEWPALAPFLPVQRTITTTVGPWVDVPAGGEQDA